MISDLRTYLAQGGDPNAYDKSNHSLLSIHRDNFECFKLLLKHGANPDQPFFKDFSVTSPIIELISDLKYKKHVMLLIEHGANVKAELFGNNLLHQVRDKHLVPILIRKGVDINQRNIIGLSPVYRALMMERFTVARALLKYRPKLDSSDKMYLERHFPNMYREWQQAVSSYRWKTVRCLVHLLSLHKRAVITANHPLRKKARGEFSVRERLTCC